MLGVELSYALGLYKYGRHQIGASTFVADRTQLSESLFTNRGRLSLQDGGPANTEYPTSVVATYDAINVPLRWGTLSYQVSGAWLGRGQDDSGRERRAGVGFGLNIPLNSSVAETLRGRYSVLRFGGEAVRRWDAGGVADQTIDYVTGSTELVHGNWFFDLSATRRHFDNQGVVSNDRLVQAAAGYSFLADTSLAFGIARKDVDGVQGTIIGTQLTYKLTTCDRCQILAKHH